VICELKTFTVQLSHTYKFCAAILANIIRYNWNALPKLLVMNRGHD